MPAKARGWTAVQRRIYVSSLSESEQLSPRLTAPKRAALAEMSESASVSTLKPVKCGACKACRERAEVPAVPPPRPLPGHRARASLPPPKPGCGDGA